MEEMRAMLDSLMGKDRNLKDEEKRKQCFKDDDVCKYYLLDFCPNDLFPNTRSDLGQCSRTHSDGLRVEFEADKNVEFYRALYEVEYISYLEKLISQVDNKIARANVRLAAPIPERNLTPEQQLKVDNLQTQISSLMKQAEVAGESGDVDGATRLSNQAASLRNEIERVSSTPFDNFVAKERQLRVCGVCGAMQSLGDSSSRFESHISGKQHMGFERIRTTLEGMKEKEAESARQKILREGDALRKNPSLSDSLSGRKSSSHRQSSSSKREDSGSGHKKKKRSKYDEPDYPKHEVSAEASEISRDNDKTQSTDNDGGSSSDEKPDKVSKEGEKVSNEVTTTEGDGSVSEKDNERKKHKKKKRSHDDDDDYHDNKRRDLSSHHRDYNKTRYDRKSKHSSMYDDSDEEDRSVKKKKYRESSRKTSVEKSHDKNDHSDSKYNRNSSKHKDKYYIEDDKNDNKTSSKYKYESSKSHRNYYDKSGGDDRKCSDRDNSKKNGDNGSAYTTERDAKFDKYADNKYTDSKYADKYEKYDKHDNKYYKRSRRDKHSEKSGDKYSSKYDNKYGKDSKYEKSRGEVEKSERHRRHIRGEDYYHDERDSKSRHKKSKKKKSHHYNEDDNYDKDNNNDNYKQDEEVGSVPRSRSVSRSRKRRRRSSCSSSSETRRKNKHDNNNDNNNNNNPNWSESEEGQCTLSDQEVVPSAAYRPSQSPVD